MARRPPAPRLCLDDAGSASEWRARRRDVGDGGERRGFAHARRAGVRGIAPRDRPLRSFSFTRRTAGGAEGVLTFIRHRAAKRSGGGGPPKLAKRAQGGGGGAGQCGKSQTTKQATRPTSPPPRYARSPSPAIAGRMKRYAAIFTYSKSPGLL